MTDHPDNWVDWHAAYRDSDSSLSHRLVAVQEEVRRALPADPDGPPVRVIDLCAGQGDDLLGAAAANPAAPRIRARLVEMDPENARLLRERVAAVGQSWEVIEGDAADTHHYAGIAPADLVMLCGVFGNVPDADVFATVAALPQLCRPGGTVIWTRHRREPDLTPRIRAALVEAGFVEVTFVAPPGAHWSVGAHRFEGRGERLRPAHLFNFRDPEPGQPVGNPGP